MAQKRQTKIKKGFTVLQSKNEQVGYVTRRDFAGLNFFFFRNPTSKKGECVISKNLSKDYHTNANGKEVEVQSVGHDDIVAHFKKEGFVEKKKPTTSNTTTNTTGNTSQ